MNSFASGPKKHYYGKGDVIVYRLYRDGKGPAGQSPVFGASVTILIYGEAFWSTYTIGDNTNLIATDSMKNFVQRETLNFTGEGLAAYCLFLAEKFLAKYPQAEGAQISATEIPYEGFGSHNVSFGPDGPERSFARLEMAREGQRTKIVELRSGLQGFRMLRLGGSAFYGFVRDEYTTLPDIRNRPLHMWLDLDWQCGEASQATAEVTAAIRSLTREVFDNFTSGSIQEIIYQIGQKVLEQVPAVSEISLEANNRTWDTISEQGDAIGIYTEARPPYGCLGLTLKRDLR